MTQQQQQTQKHPSVVGGAAQRQDCPTLETTADENLIANCIEGKTAAWDELYRRYHPRLQAMIQALYGNALQDNDFADEIAARVWFVLVKDSHRLLRRFDASRKGGFKTYINVIARSQGQQHFRSERRRKLREKIVSKPIDVLRLSEEEISNLDFKEQFLDVLTTAETQFLESFLVNEGETEYTPENTWQLRHRVLVKLKAFLADNDA